MSDERRSGRVNKGVPPVRFANTASMPSRPIRPTSAPLPRFDDVQGPSSSDEDVDQTIRPGPSLWPAADVCGHPLMPVLMSGQQPCAAPPPIGHEHSGVTRQYGLPQVMETPPPTGQPRLDETPPPPGEPQFRDMPTPPGLRPSSRSPPPAGLLRPDHELPLQSQSRPMLRPTGLPATHTSLLPSGQSPTNATPHNGNTVRDQLTGIEELRWRIRSLQRETAQYREANETLQLANAVYERERQLFQQAIDRRSSSSTAPSSDFRGFPASQCLNDEFASTRYEAHTHNADIAAPQQPPQPSPGDQLPQPLPPTGSQMLPPQPNSYAQPTSTDGQVLSQPGSCQLPLQSGVQFQPLRPSSQMPPPGSQFQSLLPSSQMLQQGSQMLPQGSQMLPQGSQRMPQPAGSQARPMMPSHQSQMLPPGGHFRSPYAGTTHTWQHAPASMSTAGYQIYMQMPPYSAATGPFMPPPQPHMTYAYGQQYGAAMQGHQYWAPPPAVGYGAVASAGRNGAQPAAPRYGAVAPMGGGTVQATYRAQPAAPRHGAVAPMGGGTVGVTYGVQPAALQDGAFARAGDESATSHHADVKSADPPISATPGPACPITCAIPEMPTPAMNVPVPPNSSAMFTPVTHAPSVFATPAQLLLPYTNSVQHAAAPAQAVTPAVNYDTHLVQPGTGTTAVDAACMDEAIEPPATGYSRQPATSRQGATQQPQPQPNPAPPQTQAQVRAIMNRRTHDLPKFSGRPEEWPLFISVFESTTRDFGYTDVENMIRLQSALTGEARKRVQTVLIQPEHVSRAIAALAKAFGRPSVLVEYQLSEARKLPRIDEHHLEDMINFSVSVDGLVTFLDNERTQHHLVNPTLLNELESKLPLSQRLKWAEVANQILPYPNLKDFQRWLDQAATLIATLTPYSTYASPPPQRKRAPPKGKHVLLNVANSTSKQSTTRCTFCGEAHQIDRCGAFQKLSVKERFDEVRKRPLCFGCLGEGHLLPSCESKKECGVNKCGRWHHPLLHETADRAASSSQQKAAKPGPDRRPKQARAARVAPAERGSAAPIEVVAAQQQSTSSTANSEASSSNTRSGQPSTVLSCQIGRPRQTMFYRIVPVMLHGPQRSLRTFALLDEGSSVSLVDATLAEELQLDGEISELNLQFVSGASSIKTSKAVQLGISGVQPGAARFDIKMVHTTKELSLPIQKLFRDTVLEKNPHLVDVPFESFADARPKLLLGLEHHHLGFPLELRAGENQQGLVAARTQLGWVVYGSSERTRTPDAVVLHVRQPIENVDEKIRLAQLDELVRQHFTTEAFGVKAPSDVIESDADKRARHILATTTRRIGERFETGLLWKQDQIKLPDSYPMALQRLVNVESKMLRNPDFARQYRAQIQSYLDKGYARKLSPSEAAQRSDRTWFLPHFAVQSASKPGKFRLVFDAAAKAHDVSLNAMLLSGPDVNVPLTRLLFRFRLGSVAVCADVREMYHQVLVREADRDSQRFLWRDGDAKVAPDVFVMNVMTFGSTCSPASAQHVKNVNAMEHEAEFPEAAEAVRRSHYVDDYVASFRSDEDATRITADVIEIHKRGGFDLRGVVSNSAAVRAHFGGSSVENRSVSLEPEPLTQKILGMTWETDDDTFRFQTRFSRVRPDVIDGTCRPSKRQILSVAMSIFDPFGLLADFMLPSKIILQELWRTDAEWDDPVSEEINDRWQNWRAQVERTKLVRIPRCYSSAILTGGGLQLHVFADASEDAFAAVAYWRIEAANGTELSFVAGKVRCAPVKLLSIPRLELQAAVLATRLMLEIRGSHEELSVDRTVLWSDSETVLKWLRCDRRRYKPFVAHRVAEVVDSAPAAWWRWVPTALNVADDATRVKTPFVFDPQSRWLHGPDWLCDDETTWPVQTARTDMAETTDEELRPKFVGVVRLRGAADFERFSKFNRLVRACGWLRRFIVNTRAMDEGRRTAGELSAIEVDQATDTVCRLVQLEDYESEVSALRSGGGISKRSSLFLLKPYIDDSGLLRVHGRTDAADELYLSSAAKRPIIMPTDHYVSMLIVRHHHEMFAHQLTDATIASVRAKFWVPKLRSLVKQVRRKCQRCRIESAAPRPPVQGQLPADRMHVYARPFTNTGLDYFGPVFVTVGRRQEKRWVALFTCMTVRAVHLEVAADMSTDSCLMCIRNLCHLRGVPALIRCDNGTNFVGARNELARDVDFFDPVAIQQQLSTKGIEWRFNCPGNPEAGGAWERLVQTVKRVLHQTLHETAPRVETLRALLLEAANMVNARPLTHIQVDPDDPEPLTPNHFLLGGPNVAIAPNPTDVEPKATRRQWQICRGLSRQFWRQFIRDYLPELTRRGRHYPEEPQLRAGDLVIICDQQQPRGQWLRGRIAEVAEGSDGVVRTATVQTAHGVLRRPVTKLAKLDVSSSSGGDVRGAECRELVPAALTRQSDLASGEQQ